MVNRGARGACSDLRLGDPLLKKLRKTFAVGIGGGISLKCDCHADSPFSLNSYTASKNVAARVNGGIECGCYG